jgi:hypothetical protein
MPRFMLETIIVVLLILWLLGAILYPTSGGLIYLLPLAVGVIVVIRLLHGREILD